MVSNQLENKAFAELMKLGCRNVAVFAVKVDDTTILLLFGQVIYNRTEKNGFTLSKLVQYPERTFRE